ncbi:MAG: transglycosylase domain-containing protein [Victivallales bacterium]|nr:transglycosylase domain-containing protein [Victivallales bacterium]
MSNIVKNCQEFAYRHWRKFILCLGGLAVVCVAFAGYVYWWMLQQHVPPEAIAAYRHSTYYYDGHGELFHIERGSDYRWSFPIPLSEIPSTMVEDVIAVEDRHFRTHHGVDYRAMLRATWQMITSRRVISGGSTISMQIGNQYCGRGTGVIYKLRQIGRAWNWEKEHTKDEILEEYFNLLPYGGVIYGVEAAARFYFGRPARDLNRAEQLVLVGMPQGPNRYRPDRHPDRAIWRRDVVLAILQRAGRITAEEAEEIKRQPLRYRDFEVPAWPVSEELQFLNYVQQLYPNRREYHTTIYPEIQQMVEVQMAKGRLAAPGVKDGAAVVIETATGKVRAMVGTLPDGDMTAEAVNAAVAWRSPGSALKPFLYGEAIQGGLITADTILQDTPLALSDYRPTNFDGSYRGEVSAAVALADSLNTPAVRLLRRLGLQRVLQVLAPLELFKSDQVATEEARAQTAARTGLSLAIGGLETRLLFLTAAYSALGRYRPPQFLEDEPGPALESQEYWSSATTSLLLKMMRTRQLPGAGNLEVAWKTGTSNGNRDAWCLAVTPEWTVGVWFGNKNGAPNPGLVGAAIAAPVAGALQYILHHGTPAAWQEDPGLVTRPLCHLSGLSLSPFCRETQPGVVVESIPLRRCDRCRHEEESSSRLENPAGHSAKLLTPAPGTYRADRTGKISFTLAMEPAEAHVYLDGQYLGKLKSGEPMTLESGPHRILVWPGEGWETAQATIVVQ